MTKAKPQPITPVAYEKGNGVYRIIAGEFQYKKFVCETSDHHTADVISTKLDMYVRLYNKHVIENTTMDAVTHNMFMQCCSDKMFSKQWAPGFVGLKWNAERKVAA